MNAGVKTIPPMRWILPLFALAVCSFGGEKDGLQVTVSRATLSRADQRGTFLNTDNIDRTQGLKIVVTNTTFKDAEAADVEWQILVRKYYSTTIYSYNGTEKLKPLRRSESAELTIGDVPIMGYRDGGMTVMDKFEWRISIKRGGLEIYTVSSTPGFAGLAKRAKPGKE
jgi:hypothetical protein